MKKLGLVLMLLAAVFMYGCNDTKNNVKEEKKMAAPEKVKLTTSLGVIVLELDMAKAPITSANFLRYVEEKFYDGTIFHRVIPGFMIQGGGHLPGMKEKETHEPIKNEASNGLSNLRGSIAMARTQIVDSASSQFFINHVDNLRLDYKDATNAGYGYCVFGKVIEGMDVVDAIAKVQTGKVPVTVEGQSFTYENVPVKDVVIIKAERIK